MKDIVDRANMADAKEGFNTRHSQVVNEQQAKQIQQTISPVKLKTLKRDIPQLNADDRSVGRSRVTNAELLEREIQLQVAQRRQQIAA